MTESPTSSFVRSPVRHTRGPARVVGRGDANLLLAERRLRRSHRVFELQPEEAGLPTRRAHHIVRELFHVRVRLDRHLLRARLQGDRSVRQVHRQVRAKVVVVDFSTSWRGRF